MKLWIRFLGEKKISAVLYLSTVLLFLAVGGLSHIENFPALMYAVALTSALWGVVFVWQGSIYVKRSRKLEEVTRHFQQSSELLSEELYSGTHNLQEELTGLLELVYSAYRTECGRWEEKAADQQDYYLMWTHQIKTPISAMKLLVESCEKDSRDSFLMREELFKIEQYVEMVLTFQRLESLSSDLVLEECDLYELLKQAARKFSVLFINKGLSLELQEMDFKVLTDKKWLGFCVEQLISNSVKYTKQGRVTIGACEEAGGITLFVEDTGMGIRPEDLPRIFERGFTGYNGRLNEKSTGIGLYLCHRVFEYMGITVQVESEVGKGTRMNLGLPVRRAEGIRA